jgi:hypothetical protein
MGEEKLTALLQESLAVATRTEAMKRSNLARVVITPRCSRRRPASIPLRQSAVKKISRYLVR